jgi:hypothetical protein
MKVALCFIISYEHILNKEKIWKEWIEPNKDIINIYFYYKDFSKIKSPWIIQHTLPPSNIYETSYYHVIPAYLSILQFASQHDKNNRWFCLLTESCCPIISPKKFRYLFFNNYQNSIMSWKNSWWNIDIHKRANLNKLPKELHLANEPWFILNRENVFQILNFVNQKQDITNLICSGGLANESLFAIILFICKQLKKCKFGVISAVTHLADWSRMASATSPYLFKEGNKKDINFIETELEKNKYAIFIRKISNEFPDEILNSFIYKYNKEKDDKLIIKEPIYFIYKKYSKVIFIYLYCLFAIFIVFLFFKFIIFNF